MTASGTYPGPGAGETPPAWLVDRLRAAGCVFAEDEAAVLLEAAGSAGELARLLARRVAGLPLEQVVGWAEFAGRRVAIDPGVFVPRRRSELLVRVAVAHLRAAAGPERADPPQVADLCCGCGAIGLAIALAVPGTRLMAGDLDPAAVRCATRNLAAVGGTVRRGDLFAALPADRRARLDVLVANAPYVPTAAIALMPPEARDHEPAVALDGGPDGTDVLGRVIAGAPGWLAPGGLLLVEVGTAQVASVTDRMRRLGLTPAVVADDELGGLIVTGAR
ncbi:putative protein N(5)-glutamine methyltransferase [Nakamurella sp.]|uniref:putative protein N(5)-glutamine methyltransferase n=1 Tax=Nakamurella sp. TaxID=1869182 RepID=UPI003B3BA42E